MSIESEDWELLDRSFITPKELYEKQEENLKKIGKVYRRVGRVEDQVKNLDTGQTEMKNDIREIKEIVIKQEVKRDFIRGCLSLLKTMPKTAKVILSLIIALLSALGVTIGAWALG